MTWSLISFIQTNFQYNQYGLFYLAGAGISLSVGLLVLVHNPKSKTNISLFLVSLFGSIWQFSYGMIFLLISEAIAYQFMGLSYLFGVTFVSPSVFWFVQNWTKRKHYPKWTALSFIIGFVLGILMFLYPKTLSPFIEFPLGRFNAYGRSTISWVYLAAVLGHMWFFASWGFKILFDAWRETTIPKEKSQYRIFIIGALIGYSATNDFFFSLGLNQILVGYISFSAYILIMSYGIIRYQFLDMDIGYKRASVIFLIYGLLVSLLIPVVVPFTIDFIKKPATDIVFSILALCLGIGAFLSLGPFLYAGLVRRNFWLKGNMSKGLTHHELKSPLSTIQGITELVKDRVQSGKLEASQLKSYIDIIKKNVIRLDKFVNDLLHIAKSDEKSHTIQKTQTNITQLIQDEIDSLTSSANAKGLKLGCKSAGVTTAEIDSEKIRQVISNLITNAIKYSSDGEITVSVSGENNQIFCSVKDHGKGIPKTELIRVFDRFYQGSSASKGAGLGLAIAKAWVDVHGGKIWAESEGEGRGTKISFIL